jgi:hypothetical protein
MNFIEAVTALGNGECEGIKRSLWSADSVLIAVKEKIEFPNSISYIPYLMDFQYDDWELVNHIPATEEVEISKWYCPICNNISNLPCAHERVLLTGHYTREITRTTNKICATCGAE